jgi:hypothetical protein
MSGSIIAIGRLVTRIVLAAVLLFLGRAQLSAHKVVPDPIVQVFLKPAGDHLAVKVWLPVIALGDANLPRTSEGRFIQDEIRAALDVVARGVARDLELQAGEFPLAFPSVATTLSPDESFVAIDLDYPLQADQTDLSARFHTFRGNGQVIATEVHYIVDDTHTRTFVVDGQPQRISFAPGVVEVFRHFVDDGIDVLLQNVDFLLLAICLIAVTRLSRTTAVGVASFLVGQVLVVFLSAVGLLTLSPSVMSALGALAASVVVVLAIQDVTSPESQWLPALCFSFGVLNGAGIGARLVHEWGFTGAHVAAALLAFVLTVSIGQAWVIALLWSAAGLIRRRGRIAELAVVSTAIFAGHASVHRVIDQGQALAEAGTFTLDRFLFSVTVGWALLILCAGIIGTALSGVGGESSRIARPRGMESR